MTESINHSSGDHSGVIKRHIAQPDGLNEAVSLAMANDALSIYKIEIGLYSYANDDRQKQGEIALFIAGSEGLGKATKVALGLVSALGFPCSKEVDDAAQVLSCEEISRLKSLVKNADGSEVVDYFYQVTCLDSSYLDDGTWLLDDEIIGPDKLTSIMIASLCNREPRLLTKLMSYLMPEGNEHQLSGSLRSH
jgi:hypothetical protein